jgi:hypothetical protein
VPPNISAELAATIDAARRRIDGLADEAFPPSTWELSLRDQVREVATAEAVQVAVRMPSELRDQIHRAAAAAGAPTIQGWMNAVLARAAADELDAGRRLSAALRDRLTAELRRAVDGGWYREAVAAIAAEDPELA